MLLRQNNRKLFLQHFSRHPSSSVCVRWSATWVVPGTIPTVARILDCQCKNRLPNSRHQMARSPLESHHLPHAMSLRLICTDTSKYRIVMDTDTFNLFALAGYRRIINRQNQVTICFRGELLKQHPKQRQCQWLGVASDTFQAFLKAIPVILNASGSEP